MKVGIGFSKHREPVLAAREALWQAKAEIETEQINLAFVFSTIELASPHLLNTLQTYLRNIPILGCSSAAVIYSSQIYPHGLVLVLISSEDLQFTTAAVREIKKKSAYLAGQELATGLLQNFPSLKRDFGMIFCDGLMEEGSKFILGLQEKLGTSFPLSGASASDNLRFSKTFLYFNREVISDAAVGILWGGKANFGLSIRHGWKPLGKPRLVTRSKGNIIEIIDGRPAVDLYKEYFAKDITALKKDLKYISTLYPIGLYLEGETEYLLRNIIAIEDNGALVCQGDVPVGSQIRLMIGTKDSCLDATRQAAAELKKSLLISPHELIAKPQEIKIVFVFDSVSRYILLRRKAAEELKIIRKAAGERVPLVGFYTYGEQAPLKAMTYHGKVHFHNQSIVLIAIGG